MANAGELLAMADPLVDGADVFLDASLSAETTLHNHIARKLGERDLAELNKRQAPFDEYQALFLRMGQSRKSRRGQSLQHHFASLLTAVKVAYSPQCETEPGETADFVIPSCEAYGDPAFPEARLRMVACKSTARDRWRQVLREAARIETKYFLTLDPKLTERLIQRVVSAGIRLFLPSPLLQRHYGEAANLGTVADLVTLLRNDDG
jgi:hypothetical protein